MKLDPLEQPWMTEASARSVMAALSGDEDCARFVGGAVRNALFGIPITDVDIATQFTPDQVVRRLEAAGLRAIATGIEHGTITALVQGRSYEVTSLRRDVETFGRRAVVAFTRDWVEDAMRRDFTINALYAAADGTLFDYSGGLDDIAARRVRFIGDARQRIREDYLRILRFFRFHAWYGRDNPDRDAIAACVSEKSGLKQLSGERVQKELLLLLQAQNPAPMVSLMHEQGILRELLPTELRLARLEHLVAIERTNGLPPDGPLRLAALLPGSAGDVRAIAQALRLSNEMRDRLTAAAEEDARISPSLAPERLKEMIYRSGADRVRDQLLLRWAASGASPADAQWQSMLSFTQDWKIPRLPVDGNDVMAQGVPEGPEIGIRLHEIEQWWIDRDFAPDRTELLERLRAAVHKTG